MGTLTRKDYAAGWVPSADAEHAPVTGALRFDNLVLDERGAVALRRGAAVINGSPFADTDIHSLYTAEISGTRYRMAGAGDDVYRNGTALSQTFAGSGDIIMSSWLDQMFLTRSTTHKKDDGSTVRNWGIAKPVGVPTVAQVNSDADTYATCDVGETASWTFDEDDGTGKAFVNDRDGNANSAMAINPKSTGRAVATKDFGSDQDFSSYAGGQTATDDDLFGFYVYVTDPATLLGLTVMIDVSDSTFEEDFYVKKIPGQRTLDIQANPAEVDDIFGIPSYKRDIIEQQISDQNRRPAQLVSEVTQSPGWSHIQFKRSEFSRIGASTGKNWSTVNAIRLIAQTTVSGSAAQIRWDAVTVKGGSERTLTGKKTWYVALVKNFTNYQVISPLSDATLETEVEAEGAQVTMLSDGARDGQVDEVWLYRQGGILKDAYRVATKAVSGTGAVTIDDKASDNEALTANIKAKFNATTPPANILGIAGPHYDRLYVLTTTDNVNGVYISHLHAPDTFDSDWIINVGDGSETPYWLAQAPGGIYVGTSKDVYRIGGDGTELPDGTLNVTLQPLHVSHAPISETFAIENGQIVYLGDDGWRVMSGAGGSQRIVDESVQLLYEGHTRHGVSAVNLTGGRFRVALVDGQLTAITPEGASTTSSAVLHRRHMSLNRWYRHTYGVSWRAIHREPDGTLIASDTAGTVWVLDSGTDDDGTKIGVVFWTSVDDNQLPFQRKDPQAYRARLDTGNVSTTIALHADGAAAATKSLTTTQNGVGLTEQTITDMSAFRQMQQRVSVTTDAFRWLESQVEYLDRPALMRGQVQPTNGGTTEDKRYSGLTIRLCTLGVQATITPIVDGTNQTTFQHTSGADNPDTVTHPFTAVAEGQEITFSSDVDIELYSWQPEVLQTLPLELKVWEQKPLQPSPVRRRFGGLTVQIDTGGTAATVTPVLDGVDQTALSVTHSDLLGTTLTFASVVGRDLWARVTASAVFRVFGVAPIVLDTFPQRFQGQTPETNDGTHARKVYSGVTLKACTVGSARTFTPILDDASQDTFAATTGASEPDTIRHQFTAPVFGTDMALSVDGDIELWDWAPTVVRTLPMPFKGRTLETDAGHSGVKTFTGIQLKVCTLGSARTFTPVIDGTSAATFSATTGSDEPDEVTHQFASAVEGTEIALSVDGNIELYDWAPLFSALAPIGVKVWDSGPITLPDGPHDLVWIYEYRILVKAAADLTITPYFDDRAFPAVTATVTAAQQNRDTRIDVKTGRGYVGRIPRVVVTATSTFYPRWMQMVYRTSGGEQELKTHTIRLERVVA